MAEPNSGDGRSSSELMKARSSAAGFSAMCFLGSVIYLVTSSNSPSELMSLRGVILLLVGIPISAFVFGYLLLFCRLWVGHFASQWVAGSQRNAQVENAAARQVAAQRLLSIFGTALMAGQLVLIFLVTQWAYGLLFSQP